MSDLGYYLWGNPAEDPNQPSNPQPGDTYITTVGCIHRWDGDRWSCERKS